MIFLLRRTVEAGLLLLLLSLCTYTLLGLMPGDPLDEMLASNPNLTPEDVTRLRQVYGLDEPLFSRYLAWLQQAVLHGDFGYSRAFNQPVATLLWPRLATTLSLMLPAFLIAMTTAFLLAVPAAARPDSWLDKLVRILTITSVATPNFWLALLCILLFAVHLGLLPASSVLMKNTPTALDYVQHYAMPVGVLAFGMLGSYLRYMRNGVVEALRLPSITTAIAKGASPMRVLFRHALGHAALPVITILALSFAGMFSGALITETMFAVPGLGKMIFDAVSGNDYNLALLGLLFSAAAVIIANTIADIFYAWCDPRTRQDTSNRRGGVL